jgi:hypothetical protein
MSDQSADNLQVIEADPELEKEKINKLRDLFKDLSATECANLISNAMLEGFSDLSTISVIFTWADTPELKNVVGTFNSQDSRLSTLLVAAKRVELFGVELLSKCVDLVNKF